MQRRRPHVNSLDIRLSDGAISNRIQVIGRKNELRTDAQKFDQVIESLPSDAIDKLSRQDRPLAYFLAQEGCGFYLANRGISDAFDESYEDDEFDKDEISDDTEEVDGFDEDDECGADDESISTRQVATSSPRP